MSLASFTAAEDYLLGSDDAVRHETNGVGTGGMSAGEGSRVYVERDSLSKNRMREALQPRSVLGSSENNRNQTGIGVILSFFHDLSSQCASVSYRL